MTSEDLEYLQKQAILGELERITKRRDFLKKTLLAGGAVGAAALGAVFIPPEAL